MAQLNGENLVMAKVSNPGKTGDGGIVAGDGGGELGSWLTDGGGSGMSGPPHVVVILVRTENARREVGRSVGERAKCSIVDIRVSKMPWLSMVVFVSKIYGDIVLQ
jgi:hypothetical protein